MKKTVFLTVCAVLAMLGTGCDTLQSWTRIKPVGLSEFLPKQELLVAQKATFPFHYFYLKKDAGTYENVYVAPVNTVYLRKNTNWAKIDQKLAQTLGSDIDKLARYTQGAFKEAFSNMKGNQLLSVVENPNQKKTLIVEVALVSIIPTKAELNVLGTAGNFLLPGIGIVTGHLAGGSISMECLIRDSQTKEIVAMYANTEKDQRAILNFAGMTWYTSAEHNIKKQAENTARVFSGADYSKIYRRIIKLIEI